MFDLTTDEREYLAETLEAAHKQLLQELHHTDRRQFKEILRQRVDLNERLLEKIEGRFEACAS